MGPLRFAEDSDDAVQSDEAVHNDNALAPHGEPRADSISPVRDYKQRADFATLGEILETWTMQFPINEDDDEDPAEDGTICTGPLKMWLPPPASRHGWFRLRLDTTSSEAHTLVQYRELLRQILARIPQYSMCSEAATSELLRHMELFRVESGSLIVRPGKKRQRNTIVRQVTRPSIRQSRPSLSGQLRSLDDDEELEVIHVLLNGTAALFPENWRIVDGLPQKWYTKIPLATSREGMSPRYAPVDVSNLMSWGLRPKSRTGTAGFMMAQSRQTVSSLKETPLEGHASASPSASAQMAQQQLQQRALPPNRFTPTNRRRQSVCARPELNVSDCLPGVRTIPPYKVLDPMSPDSEGGNVTICALEHSVIAVIPRNFLHPSELEKEADKVERRRDRYAHNQQRRSTRKSQANAVCFTMKEVLREAKRKVASKDAHERVLTSQAMLRKKLLAATLRDTMCQADEGSGDDRLPDTPDDVQILFPGLSMDQAEKVFVELAPEQAKVWQEAQQKKQESEGPKQYAKTTSWAKWQRGFRRASRFLEQEKKVKEITPQATELHKMESHWNGFRQEMGLSEPPDAEKDHQAMIEQLMYGDKARQGWSSEPIFLRALSSSEIGTQSAVDGLLPDFLSHVPALLPLSSKHSITGRSWEQVFSLFSVKRVPEGVSLLEEGEVVDRIIGIMAGEVEVTSTIRFRESSCRPRNNLIREKQTDVGEAQVAVCILGPGDFLGHFMPSEQPYESVITAKARTACRVCRSSSATICQRVFVHLLDSGSQIMDDFHQAATGWLPSEQQLRKQFEEQRRWASFKDRTVQEVVADPIGRTALTWHHHAPNAEAWLRGGAPDAYRGDIPTVNLAEGGPAAIRGGRPTSATLSRQIKQSRSTTTLVPYACRLRDKSPVFGADLAKRNSGFCPMMRNRPSDTIEDTQDSNIRPCSAPGLRRSVSAPGTSSGSLAKKRPSSGIATMGQKSKAAGN